jgi:hypothetical protein
MRRIKMKNIIGFEKVLVFYCDKCDCIFTIDDLKEDSEKWICNNKQETYIRCPNCQTSSHKFLCLDKLGCVNPINFDDF